MTKVAIYCRVDHGTSEYGQVAIDCQKKQLQRYAKQHGLIIAGYYSDCGFTGRDMNRPALQRLLRDHAKGMFKTVLVVNEDRLYCGKVLGLTQWPFKIKAVNRQTIKLER